MRPATPRIDAARRELAAGTAPLHALADALDAELRQTVAAAAWPEGVRWALLALGGYGRREMAPLSDVDIQFLVDPPASAVSEAVESCLHVWWGLRLKLGYATRTTDETVALAQSDHKTAMALLDRRLVVGDPGLLDELSAALESRLYAPGRRDHVQAILDDRARRHGRFGDTVFLLEPDLKSGEGGLRDLHGARWAALLVHGSATLAGIGITPAEATELAAAYATVSRVRNVLHGAADRGVNRLRFAYQERVAAALGEADVPGGMQRYWRAATLIRALSRRVLDTLRVELEMPVSEHIGGEGPLTPRQVLALFRRSSEEDLPLSPRLLEAAAEAVDDVDAGVRRDPEVARDLFVVLTQPSDDARPLGHLHDIGWLGALIPEFSCLRGLYQHNVFHVYTVDAHTLHAVAELKQLAASEARDGPAAVMRGLSESDRRALFLAMLLHDICKGGQPPGTARDVARRLGLGPDAEVVELLVREHLLMALLAQTRDIHDPTTLRHLAREVGDRRTLAMLYLVTWGDMSSANPELLTAWKAQLLDELYRRTDALLVGGLGIFADERHVVHTRRAEVLRLLLGVEPDHPTAQTRKVDRFIGQLPTRYALVTPAETVLAHMTMCADLAHERVALQWESGQDDTGLVTVCCMDIPGLLARLSGTLAANDVDIIGTEAFSRADGLAIDQFRVARASEVGWDRLASDLRAVVAGELDPEALLRTRERPSPLGAQPAPPVATAVSVDNQASVRFTVLDVVARDRPGLLYRVARALHRLGLNIRLARVTTEGDTAHDAFYVEWISGGKVLDAARLARLCGEVRAAIDAPL